MQLLNQPSQRELGPVIDRRPRVVLNHAGGVDEVDQLLGDAVTVALCDQLDAGLDVVTDGEESRIDFNLSFYGMLSGIDPEVINRRTFGSPADDQRGKHRITGKIDAPSGLGVVREYRPLARLAPEGVTLNCSVPGLYSMRGRLIPNHRYPDRYAITEAFLPLIRRELEALVEAGCEEITVDELSMSCYAHKDGTQRFGDIFNRTVETVVGRCRLSTHLCFGNYRGRPVGKRTYEPLFPEFLD